MTPQGRNMEFTDYLPLSLQAEGRGKFSDAPRISNHLLRAGIVVNRTDVERTLAFYRDKLGFAVADRDETRVELRVPGSRGDFLELVAGDPYPSREQFGNSQHATLEVSDVRKAYRTVQARDTAHQQKAKPELDATKAWHLNLYDPDGSRIELVESKASR